MRCFVYVNLHKQCLSVRAVTGPERGRVVAHANALLLESVFFKVSEAGRQRVVRERSKNVHAGLVGELTKCARLGEPVDDELQALRQSALAVEAPVVTYDPYKHSTFVLLPDHAPIYEAPRVLVFGKKVFVLPG
jgi:hypothetical protein